MTEKSKPVLVMLGIMGQTPFAGVAWQVLHYLEGFRRCGYEVYYVEDTGDWPYDPEQNTVTGDCRYTVNYLARLMEWAGFANRWAYRFGGDGHLGGGQVVNIVSWTFRYVIVHELCHALGMWHEPQRPDRGAYVRINTANMQPGTSFAFAMVPSALVPTRMPVMSAAPAASVTVLSM